MNFYFMQTQYGMDLVQTDNKGYNGGISGFFV